MKVAFILAAATLSTAPVTRAQSTLEPFILRGYGSTLFRLEVGFPLTGLSDSIPDDTEGIGQSELEYPLNAFAAGLKYRYEIAREAGKSIGLSLSAWTNFSQPSGKMEDSDWTGARSSSGIATSTVLFKYSYTQSRSELRWFGAEAGIDFGSYELLGKPMRYGLAVRAERFAYRMFGAEGWQRSPGGQQFKIDSHHDQLVLTYDLIRIMPRFHGDMTLKQGKAAVWKAGLSGAPAFAMDHDDHVLRGKYSDAFTFGFEIGAMTGIEFRISSNTALGVSADVRYLRSKGEMDQHFYMDDPSTPDRDETGAEYPGIRTRIIGLGGGIYIGSRTAF